MDMCFFKINIFIIISILVTKCNLVQSQLNDLRSPCPEIFSYHLNEKVYGKIHIPLYEWPSESLLNVTLSVAEQISSNYAGALEPIKDNPVNYIVHMPYTTKVPKINQIHFNNNLICYGPEATGVFVTTVRLYNIYRIVRITKPQQTYNIDSNQNNQFPSQQDNNFYRPLPNYPSYNVYNNLNTQSNSSNHNINRFNENSERIESNDNNFNNFNNFNNNIQSTTPTPTTKTTPPPKISDPPKYENEIVSPQPNLQSTSLPDYDTESVCGTTEIFIPLISFGTEITKGEYPWITAIFKETLDGIKFKCGGSLFTHQHVVTAAHCLQLGNKKTSKESLSIFIGRHNIRKWSNDPDAIVRDVENIYIHPQYSDLSTDPTKLGLRNDIAVIQLSKRVKFSNFIRPICLWRKNPDLNLVEKRRGTVVGWGRDENGVEVSPTPKQIEMPIVSEFECVRSNNIFAKFISNTTFCAGNLDDSGPCTGDSGSGFVLSENNRWTLRGIVSASLPEKEKKCDLLNYVIFTDVAQYYDWLYIFLLHDKNNK